MAEFGSKAETLERLALEIQCAAVLPLRYFRVSEWRADPERIVREIENTEWGASPLIVRSSSLHEDDPETLAPGAYLSVPNVVGRAALCAAVDAVVSSYGRDLSTAETAHQQVLVQPMVDRPELTGVMFTCDPNAGAPYIIVNYEEHGDTAAVTSGKDARLRTFYAWKHGLGPVADERLRQLVTLANELEQLYGRPGLDVELAFDHAGWLFVLQVRPLAVRSLPDVNDQQEALDSIMATVSANQGRHPYLLGEYSIFGVMPDWNPAEIIGARPRPLALSLYRKLITDGQWADQRRRYGYRDVRGFPLVLDFCGLPYVDVRASFNSLVPAELDDDLAERLVNYYLDRLRANPELHDKVEFDVLFSCYSFTLHDRLARQVGHVFDQNERDRIAWALRTLTNQLMRHDHPARREDEASIATLGERLAVIRDSELDPIARIYWLLEDCRRFGTLAFAGFARLGFVAVELLRSLVARGALTEADVAHLMASLDTATNRMLADRTRLSKKDFFARYGFLRPGTYDIRSPRYDEAPDDYFDWDRGTAPETARRPFELSQVATRDIGRLLKEHRLDVDPAGLLAFITTSIQQRENSKFEFTRHLSEALSLIKELGHDIDMGPEDLSFTSSECIDEMYRGAEPPHLSLPRCAAGGRARFDLTSRIVLPPMITDGRDVTSFHLPPAQPNYVTHKASSGPVEVINDARPEALSGKVLMLPSGDPGYDWIFSHDIAAFVTRYGGANSHMAIRANQFGIPAVIGAGDVLYRRWSTAHYLRIDCQNRRVEELR